MRWTMAREGKTSSPPILVLGSSNVDFVLKVPRFHQPGETITAETMVTAFGGKGANQAVASKRLGGAVRFITKLGDDPYGQLYRRYLIRMGFDPRGLLQQRGCPTGMAWIELDRKGENRIVVSPGANKGLIERDLERLSGFWRNVKVFVTQMEIPLSVVRLGLEAARSRNVLTLLNPSPPVRLPRDLLSLVDFLIPNEWEAQLLSGGKMTNEREMRGIAEKLLRMGARGVVITLGERGVFFKDSESEMRIEAFRVKAIDTTAAGDAFMGGFAVALAEGKPIREGLRFASGAGALATTRLGAQPSLPRRRDVEALVSKR
jgi:ribokinase